MGRIQWAGVAFAAQLWFVAPTPALAQAPTLDPQVGVTAGRQAVWDLHDARTTRPSPPQ